MQSPMTRMAGRLLVPSLLLMTGEAVLWFAAPRAVPREVLGGELVRCVVSVALLAATWRGVEALWRAAALAVGLALVLFAPGLFMAGLILTEPGGVGIGFARVGWAAAFCSGVAAFGAAGVLAFRHASRQRHAEPGAAPDPAGT